MNALWKTYESLIKSSTNLSQTYQHLENKNDSLSRIQSTRHWMATGHILQTVLHGASLHWGPLVGTRLAPALQSDHSGIDIFWIFLFTTCCKCQIYDSVAFLQDLFYLGLSSAYARSCKILGVCKCDIDFSFCCTGFNMFPSRFVQASYWLL